MKKKLALLIALLTMANTMLACAESAENTETTATSSSEQAETAASAEEIETEPEKLPLGLDASLKYNGYEMRVLTPHAAQNDSFITEMNGDLVNDALYQRDRAVEELLDITITPISYSDLAIDSTKLQNSVTAGDDVYDFMHLQGSTFFANKPTLEKILLDMSGEANLNLEAPWWNTEATRELSYNGKSIKYLIGDISTTAISGASVIFYNKQMFDNLYHDANMPYTDVIEGKWTIDKFGEYCAGAYSDTNGDGVADIDDVWGTMMNNWLMQSFYNGFSDTRFYTRDDNGYVQLDVDTDRVLVFSEKLYDLVWNNSGVMRYNNDRWHDNCVLEFSQNEMLFLAYFLNAVEREEMRSMEADYGILPFFKLDESQEEYRSDLNPSGTRWICVPVTCSDSARTAAVIEALSYYSFYDVTPVYYEEALKSKYVRDSESGQVIDIVRDSIKTDYLIGIYRSTIGQHFVNMVRDGNQNFVSGWQKTVKPYLKQMEKNYADLDSVAE